MVLGGRLGDLLGRKRIFLVGGVVFLASTALAGSAQDMPWMISVRVAQGCGAALMMPTAVAIVSNVFPRGQRGTALGVLAGGSAFFAALGPVFRRPLDEHRLAHSLLGERPPCGDHAGIDGAVHAFPSLDRTR